MNAREFTSFEQFAGFIESRAVPVEMALAGGLRFILEAVRRTAEAKIGHYQGAVAEFPRWKDLADSTENEKYRLGFPMAAPLLRANPLWPGLHIETAGLEGVVGSMSQIAYWQETGTVKMPPRPFLGPAAVENLELLHRTLGDAVLSGLVSGLTIRPQLSQET